MEILWLSGVRQRDIYVDQDVDHLFFFKNLKYPLTECVEVWCQGAQINRSWIGLERIHHSLCERIWYVECD